MNRKQVITLAVAAVAVYFVMQYLRGQQQTAQQSQGTGQQTQGQGQGSGQQTQRQFQY